jgi:cytochrome c oxidase subunit 2
MGAARPQIAAAADCNSLTVIRTRDNLRRCCRYPFLVRGREKKMEARPHRSLRRCLTWMCIAGFAACSGPGEHPQTTFEPVSEFGRSLNSLFANTFWWTIGILVLVEALIVLSAYRYRDRPGAPKPKQIHGNVKLEFLWTVIPGVIVLFIAIPTIQATIATQRRAPSDALVVEVIGHQWWWEFKYPEYNVTTANELVLPVGRNIDLKMHSADVIHSFWIPRVGGKRDVNPQPRVARGESGPRSNHLTFNLDSAGYFLGQCAEFCGLSHAIMRSAVLALPAPEFDRWITSMGGRPGRRVLPEPSTGAATVETGPGKPPVAQPTAVPSGRSLSGAGQPNEPRDTLSTADTLRGVAPQTPLQGPALPAGPLSESDKGKQVFTSRACIACHTVQGTTARGVLGPNLTRFGARRYVGAGARRNTLENVIAWITSPQSMKPGALMPGARVGGGGMPPTGLSADEIRAVATYLMSLK